MKTIREVGESVQVEAPVKKPRKPRKPVTMGEVRIAEVLRVDSDGTADLAGLPPGATILVLDPADKYEPRPDANAARKLIAGMEGDHAVVRLCGSASVKAESVTRLVSGTLDL